MRSRLLAAAVGLVLALVVAEFAVRAWLPAAHHHLMYVKSADPVLGVDLRPKASFTFEGAFAKIPGTQVRISSQGLRDEEHVLPKPDGLRRAVCLGDSTTFGWGVEEPESWCSQLEGLLGEGWETVNLGVPGANSVQEVQRLAVQGLRFEPDLVVVHHEEGDAEPPLSSDEVGTVAYHVVGRVALARMILGIVVRGEAQTDIDWEAGDEGIVGEDGYDGDALMIEAFARLARLGRDEGFEVAVFSEDAARPGFAEALARQQIPLHAIEGVEADERIPGDGHWTPGAHRRVAQFMAEEIAAGAGRSSTPGSEGPESPAAPDPVPEP